MSEDVRPSGIESIGALPWGTHFCQFYGERDDLIDTLVPFFKAGLEAGEKCLWVTADPLRAHDAEVALRQAVPGLSERKAQGQVEIIDHHDWYTRTGKPDADDTLQGWVEQERQALAAGFAGLRLTGNTYWVERTDWDGFMDYEARVSGTFENQRIIALCSYCLGRCQPADVLDVVSTHSFALTRRNGAWQQIESASLSRAKQELHQANRLLEERVQERTAALENAVRARDQFLSVASHELRTPLTSLQLYVDSVDRAAAQGALSAEAMREKLAKVRAQTRRLDKLINNLLDVSRADAKLPLSLERVELAELAATCVEHFSEQFARAACPLQLDLEEGVVGLWDRLRLEQAVTNLLQNVVRYAPGAEVKVNVRARQGEALLSVCDRGPGIPAEHLPRLFRRFAQAPSPHFSGGFGLGLWLVKQSAEAHGGTITVESAPGKGTTFTLQLPLSER